MVIVDDTENDINCIRMNPLNQEQTSTQRVKQGKEHSTLSIIDLMDTTKWIIGADTSD